MHAGRSEWTWYTGSAGWLYQAAIDGLLGLRRGGTTFATDPCIPARWGRVFDPVDGWIGSLRHYCSESGTACCGVRSAELDCVAVDANAIPLLGDASAHEIVVVLGTDDSSAARPSTTVAGLETRGQDALTPR
jgi:cyclic beta-1,2-glucan synthetase